MAYELQTNRTTYDLVFTPDAAQVIKFEPRVEIRTLAVLLKDRQRLFFGMFYGMYKTKTPRKGRLY